MQGINGTNTPRAFSRMICGAALIPILIPTLRLPSPTFILSLIPKKKTQTGRTSLPAFIPKRSPQPRPQRRGAFILFFMRILSL